MASINGITVKGITRFRGHEGEPLYQGNIYLGNKKIGFWSQDAHGGCDNIHLDQPYSITKLENKVKMLNKDHKHTFARTGGSAIILDYDLELLFGDLIVMQEDEKDFKKAIKNGFAGVLLVTDGYHIFGWNLSNAEVNLTHGELLEKFAKGIEDGKKKHKFFKEDGFTKHEIKVYRSVDDFKVGETISLNDISR